MLIIFWSDIHHFRQHI